MDAQLRVVSAEIVFAILGLVLLFCLVSGSS